MAKMKKSKNQSTKNSMTKTLKWGKDVGNIPSKKIQYRDLKVKKV